MGLYIYTPRKATKTLITGEVVAKASYAYKDSWNDNFFSKSQLRQIDRMETRGGKNAVLHNEAGVKLVARGDKWEVGMPIYKYETRIPGRIADSDMGGGKHIGYLARDGKDWFISVDDRSLQPERITL